MNTTTANLMTIAFQKRFSKQDLFEELAWFMPTFASSVERMYGIGAALLMRSPDTVPYKPSLVELQATPMWQSLSQLYDYGVNGVLPVINELGDGSLADVEMFVMGLGGLEAYLEEDESGIPSLSRRTVELANARHILDGGVPYTNFDCSRPIDHVSLTHVSLLVDLEEPTVRTSLDASDVGPLTTGSTGGQTYLPIEEARRWLAGRDEFVPTGMKAVTAFNFAKSFDIELPVDVIRAIGDRAASSKMNRAQVLRLAFADEIARDSIYGTPRTDNVSNRRACPESEK